MDSAAYQDSTTKSNYIHIRQQTDWHHTKWSGYKKPENYHPYNGMDFRSEYLYTRRDDENSTYISPRKLMALEFADNYRFYIYLGLFGLS